MDPYASSSWSERNPLSPARLLLLLVVDGPCPCPPLVLLRLEAPTSACSALVYSRTT
jgi:hypothetical protein